MRQTIDSGKDREKQDIARQVYDDIDIKEFNYLSLSETEASKGNYRTALDYAYKSLEQSDSIKQIGMAKALKKIRSLYNSQRIEDENQKLIEENVKRKIWIYQLILGLLLVVSIILWNFHHLRRKKEAAIEQEKKLYKLKAEQYANSLEMVEKNKEKVMELEGLLHEVESQKDILRKELIQTQKKLLELSNHQILVFRNEKDLLELSFKKSDIYLYFHYTQRDKSSNISEERWNELRTAINITYSNFTTRLYDLYPQLTELELRICYLIKILIPVTNIARIVNRSTSAITASRIRLYKKIHGTEGTAEMMDTFINDF